jgi:hypothetical protein
MKPIYIILLGSLGIAVYLFAIGFKDMQRYREMRAM